MSQLKRLCNMHRQHRQLCSSNTMINKPENNTDPSSAHPDKAATGNTRKPELQLRTVTMSEGARPTRFCILVYKRDAPPAPLPSGSAHHLESEALRSAFRLRKIVSPESESEGSFSPCAQRWFRLGFKKKRSSSKSSSPGGEASSFSAQKLSCLRYSHSDGESTHGTTSNGDRANST